LIESIERVGCHRYVTCIHTGDLMRNMAMVLMGLGGIIISFGAVVFVIELFAGHFGSVHGLRVMTATGTGLIFVGAVLFGSGFLFSRIGRKDGHPVLLFTHKKPDGE
jgi:hypothetical protein